MKSMKYLILFSGKNKKKKKKKKKIINMSSAEFAQIHKCDSKGSKTN